MKAARVSSGKPRMNAGMLAELDHFDMGGYGWADWGSAHCIIGETNTGAYLVPPIMLRFQ